jgi:two-component system LytT family response regulator
MRVLIVEDEQLAAERLIDLIGQYDETITIAAQLDSVKSAVAWLQEHPAPDLAFFDIQLADGLSFQIFDEVAVRCPVIFTTAYDQYALKAFKVNSIDYLLKPLDLEELSNAFEQYQKLKGTFSASASAPAVDLQNIQRAMQMLTRQFKARFVIKTGAQLTSVPTSAVAYFFSEHKLTWLVHEKGKKFVVDYTLEQLEDMLDPTLFFRLNRKYLAQIDSIQKVVQYTNSRLKVLFYEHPKGEDVVVSREKATQLKRWLGGEGN